MINEWATGEHLVYSRAVAAGDTIERESTGISYRVYVRDGFYYINMEGRDRNLSCFIDSRFRVCKDTRMIVTSKTLANKCKGPFNLIFKGSNHSYFVEDKPYLVSRDEVIRLSSTQSWEVVSLTGPDWAQLVTSKTKLEVVDSDVLNKGWLESVGPYCVKTERGTPIASLNNTFFKLYKEPTMKPIDFTTKYAFAHAPTQPVEVLKINNPVPGKEVISVNQFGTVYFQDTYGVNPVKGFSLVPLNYPVQEAFNKQKDKRQYMTEFDWFKAGWEASK